MSAEDQVKAVRELHREMKIYEAEDLCPFRDNEVHCDQHHFESDEANEYLCDLMVVDVVCENCREGDGGYVEWPCATIRAIKRAE